MTKRFFLSVALLPFFCFLAGAQDQPVAYEYAFLVIEQRELSPQVRVPRIELGDSPEQNQREKIYEEALKQKQSLAAVLQFMSEQGYELLQAFYEDEFSRYPEVIMRRRLGD